MGLELVGRASRVMLLVLAPATVGGGLLAGWAGASGVLAGGLVSLASFRWLARAVARADSPGAGVWRSTGLAAGLRHLALFGALAVALSAGAHPVAVLGGLSLLPPILIGLGLRAARLAP